MRRRGLTDSKKRGAGDEKGGDVFQLVRIVKFIIAKPGKGKTIACLQEKFLSFPDQQHLSL